MNYQLVWIRRDWWLCSRHSENTQLNTGKIPSYSICFLFVFIVWILCATQVCMNSFHVLALGCLCGGLCSVSQRTRQHTAVWLTKACIQPSSRCIINTPSKITNCREDCRGALSFLHTHALPICCLQCIFIAFPIFVLYFIIFNFFHSLVLFCALQGFVCFCSLGSHLRRCGISPSDSLSLC